MVRRLIWSVEARKSRKNIFEYWNNRNKSKVYSNKSKVYSNKLNILFNDNLIIVSKLPEFGKSTFHDDIKSVIISHFEIIYKITHKEIIVIDIWDTRQSPTNFPLK